MNVKEDETTTKIPSRRRRRIDGSEVTCKRGGGSIGQQQY
jgi:hypothetical protein